MDANGSYFIDVLLLVMGLHFISYVIYGRLKGKALIGGYRPGVAGYDAFRKLIENNKLLIITIIVTVFFIVNAVLDARKVLQEPSSHSILVVAPVMIVVILLALSFILPAVFKKK